jgi:hypothetical protein
MKAASLLVVFLLAKVLILAGRDLPLSWWSLSAYLWQDVLVVLLFAGFHAATRRRPWIGSTIYFLIVGYVAVNVPIARLFSTPLTWMLLHAASGTLADSILHHCTGPNLLRVAAVLAVGALMPRLRWQVPPRVALPAVGLGVIVVLLGPQATARVETLGLHRNVFEVLVTTALPRIEAVEYAGQWRVSPMGSRRDEDLTRWRGTARGRNVVVIHLESTGARYLRPWGADLDPMPHLTELARQAILFENAYTVYPETIKSFFAVQCSTYPALDTQPAVYELVTAPGFASLLGAEGYRTGLFHSGRFMYLGMESVLKNRGYQTLEDAGDIGGERESSFGIDEQSTVRRMLAWIDSGRRDRPFLLTYLPIAGHHPYSAPEGGPFPAAEEIDRYRNSLHYSDASVHALLLGLQQRGLYENTLFVIFGDHAEAFDQHPGNNGNTFFLYDENVRVPYLVAAPGLIHEAVRVSRVASLVDTAPTILDLLGLPRPEEYQGRSLLDAQQYMALFCTDYSLLLLGLRDENWKMIDEPETGRAKLFDLQNDPDEQEDVAAVHPERVEAYREHLRRWAAAQKHFILQSR